MDIFGILSRNYLEAIEPLVPDPSLIALAPDVTISYIGVQPAGTLIPLTSGLRLPLTHHYADAAVAPGRLDVVLVPGPDPREAWEDGALAWLRRQAAAGAGTDVLSVCTGAYVCARAGLLTAGRRACGPRSMQADLRRSFEGVVWVGDERRWERDGNFWSSGALKTTRVSPFPPPSPPSQPPGGPNISILLPLELAAYPSIHPFIPVGDEWRCPGRVRR